MSIVRRSSRRAETERSKPLVGRQEPLTDLTLDVDPRTVRSRSAVLDATVSLMVERGVHAVSVDAIAERSGVAKTTVYRHWPTREALILAAWLTLSVIDPLPTSGDLETQVAAAAIAFATRIGTPPMAMLLPELLALARRDQAMRAVYDQLLRARRSPVLSVVSEAIVSGVLPADADADLVTNMIVGPIVYHQLLLLEPVDRDFVHRLVMVVLGATLGEKVQRVDRQPNKSHKTPKRFGE